MTEKPWEGRFAEKTHHLVEGFTSSIDIDKRLYAYDIEGSVAHSKMLAKQGIISEDDAAEIIRGLGMIKREIERGEFQFDDSLEDIHMHIEARLVQLVGKVAQKLHTARSRNDQVALDVRLYLRAETRLIIDLLIDLQKVLVVLAGTHRDIAVPGYTHLQRAQPVLLAHHWLAYYEMFARDTQRLEDCFKRINVMPLGSAALAGTPHPIDRQYVAELLEFPAISRNSMDSVADRDFMIEFQLAASLAMIHFSRLSEELILWSSAEFQFIELPDAFATGSSIMPQKKNPDVPELVRGKAGRVIGSLVALLTLMKSLPLAYNRDMQEDKPPLFDAVDTLKACIRIFIAMLPRIRVNEAVMSRAASTGYLNATDLADYLVAKGMPFRKAHSCVGQAVRYGIGQQKELQELTLDELRDFSGLIEADVFEILSTQEVINRRQSAGGTSSDNVLAAIEAARAKLEMD
jgi:argininosuccinate lyase